MTRRWLLLFLIVPFAAFLERFAYYGVRSVMVVRWVNEGLPQREVADTSSFFSLAVGLTPLVGALACALIKPRWTMLAGAGLTALGYGSFAVAPYELRMAPLALIALGLGLFRPAVLAAAVTELPDPFEALRGAFFALFYCAVNAAALAAPAVSASLGKQFGFDTAIAACAGAMVIAVVAAALFALLMMEGEPAEEPLHGRGLLAAPIFLAALVLLAVVQQLAGDQVARQAHDARGLFTINPAVVLAVGFIAAAVLLGLHASKARVPTASLFGAGLVLVGAGAALGAVDGLMVAGLVVCAAGEGLAAPLGLARLGANLHPRAAAVPYAVYMMLNVGVFRALAALAPESGKGWVVAAGVFCALAGAALAALGPLLTPLYGAPPAAPSAPGRA